MKKGKFKSVYEAGNSVYSKLTVAYFKYTGGDNDLGIVISKKVGNSVVRHRYTRLIREVFRLNKEHLPAGYDIIVIAKRSIVGKSYAEIEDDFFRLIHAFEKYGRHEKVADKDD
ncbi:MAG: ribonuclease P protein component [Eubacteriales bacterium]|nr:ribonuclease P protein component [Eubacteriales bacterium]